MVILDNGRLYEKLRGTISRLHETGNLRQASELRSAMSISSAPGEILGEVRMVLQSIARDQLTKEMLYDVESEITYINSVLG